MTQTNCKTLILLIMATLAMCNSYAKRQMTLREALSGNYIKTKYFSGGGWLDDGENYAKIETNESGETEIIAYAASDGARKTLVPAHMFTDKTSGQSLKVEQWSFSPDKKLLLIFTNSRRVWRLNTRGDYWVLNLADGKLTQLGKGLEASRLMFAKFSPDSKKVAYVYKNNIYVEDLTSNTYKQITQDGCDSIVNGTFDWVYEEEFSCRDGFRWSGDSKYIAYWQSDTSGTGWFDIINNVDSLYPTIERFPYPKAGTTNSAVKIGYVKVEGGSTTWLPIPGNARENYLPRMEFIPNTNKMLIQQMTRQQNTNTLWTATIGSNDLKTIFIDKDSAWLETNDDIRWLKNNKYFTWTSERDGWRHIYRISADGSEITPITRGDYDVIRVVGLSEKQGYIYFIASPHNATQRYLYRTKLWGNGKSELMSDASLQGQHSYNMSPTCSWAIHTFSNARTLPQIEMIDVKRRRSVRPLVDNSEGQAQLDSLHLPMKEFLKVRSGNLLLDAWMIKPTDFDSTKTYPVIVDVYGEPAGSTVQDVWSGKLWHQYLANQGYIIVSIENRGAAAPRGRQWRKCIYGEVGTFASQDQAQGIMDLARQCPYIDPTRIGITGWSGGGSQTLNCMFRYPDIFRTGIAIAFVADQRLYDTIYQERYMDTPQNNPEGYRKGSPITYAEGLKGNLLLVHGTGDDNVHYQNCERLVNELVRHGKIFYQLSYPMRTHGISEREGTTHHLYSSFVDFWKKNL